MRRVALIIVLIAAFAASAGASAQRRVTPVNNSATATQHVNENKLAGDSIDRSRLVEMTDSKGNIVLIDTITGREVADTIGSPQFKVPKMIYPLWNSVTVSADIFQLAMRAMGQKHGLVGFGAELNLHNRYIPVVEIGLGSADNTPEDNNYTYKSPIAPYFKIGVNYNFLYNSNPDYLIFAGVRYGFSPFKFSVTGHGQGGYWDEPVEYTIPEQSVTASYLEFMLGLRVKIIGNFSLGWSVRYHSLLSDGSTPYGKPWYVPGYGVRNSSFNGEFNLSYTLPLRRKSDADPLAQSIAAQPLEPVEEENPE